MTAANYKVSNGLDVAGPLTALSGASLTGTLVQNGPAVFMSSGSFTGALVTSTSLAVNGAGGLYVAGASTVGGTSSYGGAATFSSTASFAGLLTANAGLTVIGTSSQSGAASFGSTASFAGVVTAASALNVTGAAALASTLTVAGAQTTNGIATCNAGLNTTTLSATNQVTLSNYTPLISNGYGNLSSADNASTFHLTNPAGGDVALAFESSAKYGLKLGINSAGGFYIGGWSDGASTFRLTCDLSGNLTTKGAITTTYVTASGGITSAATITGKGNYVLRPTAAGVQQSYIFQDVSGNNLGFMSQYSGGVFITASPTNQSNITIDPSGNMSLNGTGWLHTGGDVQSPTLAVTSGTITLGTTSGNGTNAGQVVYSGGNTILYAGSASLYVNTAGHAYVTPSGSAAQLITTTSSARSLKENIVPHSEALRTIQALPVVEFNYTEASGFDATEKHVGFIAEDVADLVPQAYVDVEGSPSIFLTKFVPDLWRGVQQLIDWNNGLERRLAAQGARNDALEARLKTLEAKLTT